MAMDRYAKPARLLLALSLLPGSAAARTLSVGPGQAFETPSAAAREAGDGDTVSIAPGDYYDCAVWRQNRLTIAGAAPGVRITDTTCQGKALFVIMGNDTTVLGLTLARARVPDRNGAGIRLEGQGLILRDVAFVNNEVGILAGGAGGSIAIDGCVFEDGGAGGDRPTFAAMIGPARLLRIENTRFTGVKGGQIASAADRTELIGNWIQGGTGEAPAVAILASGGALSMANNRLTIGPVLPRLAAAVLATGRGPVALRDNVLTNATDRAVALVVNWTGTDPAASGNTIGPIDTEVSTHGLARHMASIVWHAVFDRVRGLAGLVKRGLSKL